MDIEIKFRKVEKKTNGRIDVTFNFEISFYVSCGKRYKTRFGKNPAKR